MLLVGLPNLTGNALHDENMFSECMLEFWSPMKSLPDATGVSGISPPAIAVLHPHPEHFPQSRCAAWLGAMRSLPGLWGSTPALAVGDPATDGPLAVAGWLAPDADPATILAAIENWTGPLADPAFRDGDDPAYRLLRLVGMTRATAMLGRLGALLAEGEAAHAAGDGPELRQLAHRIAGAAGMHGFAGLGALWQRIEQGESIDPAVLAAATDAVTRRIRRWPGR